MLFSVLNTAYSQNVGINVTGSDPDPKALLDVDAAGMSTKGGLLIPRMNVTERNTLSGGGSMTESLLIYNTTTQCFEAWNATTPGWVAFGCLNCQMPNFFGATTATFGCTWFTANWSASIGATGYYLDVSTNSTFSSFVAGFENLNVSNVLSYSLTDVPPNTTYYYRVRAVNACGTSINSNTIQVTTMPSSTLSAGCNPCQVVADYGALVTYAGKTWITRNLGANAIATSYNSTIDAQAGCYFQFNRSQPYGHDNAGSVNPAWTINNITINEFSNWLITNDPCRLQLGGTWRLPTQAEWGTAANLWPNSPIGAAVGYTSVLKLHRAGDTYDNILNNRGLVGEFWSSTQQFYCNAMWLQIFVDDMIGEWPKDMGLSVRCLKD